MYYVYILQSLKDKKYYTGSTENLERRVEEHNSGATKSLKFRRPLVLIYKENFESRKKAVRREKQIKSYKCGEAFKKLIGADSSAG